MFEYIMPVMMFAVMMLIMYVFVIQPSTSVWNQCSSEFPDYRTNVTQYNLVEHCRNYPDTYGVKP